MKTLLTFLKGASLLLTLSFLITACGDTQAENTPPEKFSEDNGSTFTSSTDSMITLKTGLDNSKFLFTESGSTGYYYVETKAATYNPSSEKARARLNLSLVIDRSGSMEGQKLDYAKRAAKHVINQLAEDDLISIVVYDDEIEVVANSARVGDKEVLRRRIDGIRSLGSTNLGGGMMEGYKQVKSTYKDGYVNRVLLLSDGLANVGITDVYELQRIAKSKNLEDGITISTFGIGIDYNEDLMTGLSEYGSGNYYFIKNPDEIPGIFERELKGLLNVVAQNTVLTVELPNGVQLDKVFGYKYEQSGNRVIVNFRDIFSGETKAVMLRFKVKEKPGSPYEFRATLTYNEAISEAKKGYKLDAVDYLSLAESEADLEKSISAEIKAQVVLFESNDKLEQAMREVDLGNYDRARGYVDENAVYLKSNSKYVAESEELQRQESTNTSYQLEIKDAEQMDVTEIKTMQKATKGTNYEVRKKR